MALIQKNSARSRIKRTETYKQGHKFTTRSMANELGLSEGMVRAAIMALKDCCELSSDGDGTYWKRTVHPIHRRTLIDPTPLEISYE